MLKETRTRRVGFLNLFGPIHSGLIHSSSICFFGKVQFYICFAKQRMPAMCAWLWSSQVGLMCTCLGLPSGHRDHGYIAESVQSFNILYPLLMWYFYSLEICCNWLSSYRRLDQPLGGFINCKEFCFKRCCNGWVVSCLYLLRVSTVEWIPKPTLLLSFESSVKMEGFGVFSFDPVWSAFEKEFVEAHTKGGAVQRCTSDFLGVEGSATVTNIGVSRWIFHIKPLT